MQTVDTQLTPTSAHHSNTQRFEQTQQPLRSTLPLLKLTALNTVTFKWVPCDKPTHGGS